MTISKTLRRGVLMLGVLLVTAAAAFAGPYEDARAAYQRGDYRGALRLLEQVRRAEPDNPRVFLLAGSTYAKMGDARRARAAWDQFLRLDPEMRSINGSRNQNSFLSAYRQVGGRGAPVGAGRRGTPGAVGGGTMSGGRGATAPNEIIVALTNGNVYVDPDLKGSVDSGALVAAARSDLKIVAVETVHPFGSTREMAARLREALNLGEGVVVVGTPRRIGASSGRLSPDQINRALKEANLNQASARGGLGAALVAAARATSGEVVSDRRTDTNRSNGLLFLALAGAGGFVGYRS
jgi:hypothetical protein